MELLYVTNEKNVNRNNFYSSFGNKTIIEINTPLLFAWTEWKHMSI